MPQTIILALGYLTLPLVVKSTVKATDKPANVEDNDISAFTTPHWSFGNTISIASFLKDPPGHYPTVEKHVLKLAEDAFPHEQETSNLLSNAMTRISSQFSKDNGKPICALILLASDSWGILSVTEEPTVYTLHVLQPSAEEVEMIFPNQSINVNTPSTARIAGESIGNDDGFSKSFILEDDQLVKPAEMMRLCQLAPQSQPQLISLAGQVYGIASLYGYWDYWRVFEGICNNYQISASQLINIYHQQQTQQ